MNTLNGNEYLSFRSIRIRTEYEYLDSIDLYSILFKK
jgi:hypothetical protein